MRKKYEFADYCFYAIHIMAYIFIGLVLCGNTISDAEEGL
jgi:hypothetical protein